MYPPVTLLSVFLRAPRSQQKKQPEPEPEPEPELEPEPEPEPEDEYSGGGQWMKVNKELYEEFYAAEDSDSSIQLFEDMMQIDAGPENMRVNILSEFLIHILM